MEPKSPGYEKLLNDRSPGGKKRLRFKFTRMLSTCSMKTASVPASPTTPRFSPQNFDRQANSMESLRRSAGNTTEESKPAMTLVVPVSTRPTSLNIR
ncbi:hypothetical protein RN001_013255 [Aquatica leii]|uniref:Uncharacterized protein n=1 Tax=Aquatica leii TaxID=1421715 RepID=A0AAN7NW76_9COLE|nr:hypothetical protein RN001_013255 [Aquatica leii]